MMRRSLVVASVLAVLLSVVPAAHATTPKLRYVYSHKPKFVASTDLRVSKKVSCPNGMHVTGGGVDAGPSARILGSQPFDGADADHRPDDGWQGIVAATGASDTSLYVYAICSDGLSLTYAKGTGNALATMESSVLVACPDPTTHVLGGGGSVAGKNAAINLFTSESYTDLGEADIAFDDGWVVSANNNSGQSQPMKVFAICSPELPEYVVRTDQVDDNELVSQGADCTTADHQAVGGGFAAGGGANMVIGTSRSSDLPSDADDLLDNGWYNVALNQTGAQQNLGIEAICRTA